jgi:hypothetical protein
MLIEAFLSRFRGSIQSLCVQSRRPLIFLPISSSLSVQSPHGLRQRKHVLLVQCSGVGLTTNRLAIFFIKPTPIQGGLPLLQASSIQFNYYFEPIWKSYEKIKMGLTTNFCFALVVEFIFFVHIFMFAFETQTFVTTCVRISTSDNRGLISDQHLGQYSIFCQSSQSFEEYHNNQPLHVAHEE